MLGKKKDILERISDFRENKSIVKPSDFFELRDLYKMVVKRVEEALDSISDAKSELMKQMRVFSEREKQAISELNATFSKKLSEIQTMVGPQGEKGESGKDGKDGKDGKNGKDGFDGKDGSSDTANQIAQKLNSTQESISMSVIAGLEKEIKLLQRELRKKTEKGGGGGGGMGQTQHETKNVSSATTTITTNFPISGGGYGIMGAYYQSAFIVRGEHYTVGGDRRTLTLLFTPEDNTKIDLVYVR